MRKAFIEELIQIAELDERIVFLTADLGYNVVEEFVDKFPNRFINVGVSEQNMIGIATGMAKEGLIPFTYSIIPFSVIRPLEIIRQGPIKHNLKVRMIGVGSGVDYAYNGYSHFGLEDIGILNNFPNINIFSPGDYNQTKKILFNTYDLNCPLYYRLGRNVNNISELNMFDINKCNIINYTNNKDVLIVVTGNILNNIIGLDHNIIYIPCLKPFPEEDFINICKDYSKIVVLENHFIESGLGSIIVNVLNDNNIFKKVHKIGFSRDNFDSKVGYDSYYYEKYGLSKDIIKRKLDLI